VLQTEVDVLLRAKLGITRDEFRLSMPAVSVLAKASYGEVDITSCTAAMLMSEREDHFVAGTTEVTIADGVCGRECVCQFPPSNQPPHYVTLLARWDPL
jgi:hypothetical protein